MECPTTAPTSPLSASFIDISALLADDPQLIAEAGRADSPLMTEQEVAEWLALDYNSGVGADNADNTQDHATGPALEFPGLITVNTDNPSPNGAYAAAPAVEMVDPRVLGRTADNDGYFGEYPPQQQGAAVTSPGASAVRAGPRVPDHVTGPVDNTFFGGSAVNVVPAQQHIWSAHVQEGGTANAQQGMGGYYPPPQNIWSAYGQQDGPAYAQHGMGGCYQPQPPMAADYQPRPLAGQMPLPPVYGNWAPPVLFGPAALAAAPALPARQGNRVGAIPGVGPNFNKHKRRCTRPTDCSQAWCGGERDRNGRQIAECPLRGSDRRLVNAYRRYTTQVWLLKGGPNAGRSVSGLWLHYFPEKVEQTNGAKKKADGSAGRPVKKSK